ncbi:unnamed protein product [Meganyctiphanes norvegica]|uniref:Uncharacterized protein n=1 Tax=Meganyctiphanes norvegica TaxID=48144 RepID=A0AAV2RSB6_MEGNR
MSFLGKTPLEYASRGLSWLWKKNKYVTVGVVTVVATFQSYNYVKKLQMRQKWNEAGWDVVVLHIFPRGRFCPNLSPFVLKLETYLRMAEIPHQVDFLDPIGPKGKCPWITLNGEEISDSQLIIERLGEKYNKNFSINLTPEQLAVARAFQIMNDEHLYWGLIVWRYVIDAGHAFVQCFEVPFIFNVFLPFLLRKYKSMALTQGIALHGNDEIEHIIEEDLEAISVYLGDKPFLMGSEPCEVDCAIFGMMAQIVWNSPGSPYLRMIEVQYPNLNSYCQRMKERFWPDWNQCLNPPRSNSIEG